MSPKRRVFGTACHSAAKAPAPLSSFELGKRTCRRRRASPRNKSAPNSSREQLFASTHPSLSPPAMRLYAAISLEQTGQAPS